MVQLDDDADPASLEVEQGGDVDVLLTRVGCAFLGKGDTTAPVADLAAGLKERDALLIYPEGSEKESVLPVP